MEWIFSTEGLVTILGIIVILILLSVLFLIVFILKTIKDIQETVRVVKKTTREIETEGFVPFMKNSQMRSDLVEEIRKKIPKVLPIVASGFVYSVFKKILKGNKKNKVNRRKAREGALRQETKTNKNKK